MRLMMLSTATILSLATVASAEPWHRDWDHHDNDRYDHDRYDRDDYDHARPDVPRDQWSLLVDHVRLDRDMAAVRVPLDGARLRTIELQALNGWADITQVSVQYSDHHIVPIRLQRSLSGRSPNLRLDLGPEGLRGVSAIVVYGRGRVAFRVIGG